MSALSTYADLVRDPGALLDEAGEDGLARLAPPMLALLLASSAVIGASIGSHHSALQGLYAAIKLPLVFLVPPLLAVPAIAAVADALGVASSPRRAAAAGLCAMTRVAVFALAFMPVAWLFSTASEDYVLTALSTAAHLAFAGLFGIHTLMLAAPGIRTAAWTTRLGVFIASCLLFGAITAQTGWLLRPFILMPNLSPQLFQPPESDIFTEIWRRLYTPEIYAL